MWHHDEACCLSGVTVPQCPDGLHRFCRACLEKWFHVSLNHGDSTKSQFQCVHHITSHHITSHHITSHHITSHHASRANYACPVCRHKCTNRTLKRADRNFDAVMRLVGHAHCDHIHISLCTHKHSCLDQAAAALGCCGVRRDAPRVFTLLMQCRQSRVTTGVPTNSPAAVTEAA